MYPQLASFSTSFRKKCNEVRRIPGTKVSHQNAQLLTSTGVTSLDRYIGGGVAVGSVVLLEEDFYQTYSNVLVKYFLAEGVTNDHSVLVAADDVLKNKLLVGLPSAVGGPSNVHQNNLSTDEDLKIAWRYKDQRLATEPLPSGLGHNYDLSSPMSRQTIADASLTTWNLSMETFHTEKFHDSKDKFVPKLYLSLLKKVKMATEVALNYATEYPPGNSLLRIVICSVGSPLWNSSSDTQHTLARFLFGLRAILRPSLAVALVTVSPLVLEDAKLRSKLHQMSDTVIRLEPFIGTVKEENPLFKDFDGLIEIVKLPHLNSFAYQVPTSDLAFKLRKKNFQIECLHLPPDVQDPSDEQILLSCGASSKLLDF